MTVSLSMSYSVHHTLQPKLYKSVSSLQTISKLRSETFNKFLQFQEFLWEMREAKQVKSELISIVFPVAKQKPTFPTQLTIDRRSRELTQENIWTCATKHEEKLKERKTKENAHNSRKWKCVSVPFIVVIVLFTVLHYLWQWVMITSLY